MTRPTLCKFESSSHNVYEQKTIWKSPDHKALKLWKKPVGYGITVKEEMEKKSFELIFLVYLLGVFANLQYQFPWAEISNYQGLHEIFSFCHFLSRPEALFSLWFKVPTDRPIHNVRPSKSGDWKTLVVQKTWIDGLWGPRNCERFGRAFAKLYVVNLSRNFKAPESMNVWSGKYMHASVYRIPTET